MSKIIKIEANIVYIGMEDGSIKEARFSDFSFEPVVGENVEVFENENTLIVSKVKEEKTETQPLDGINININNSNTNNPNVDAASINYNGGKKVVNKAIYCILALLLGGLGAHKFYAGKIGTGILYIIFCITYIPLILSIIELIIGLCQKADNNGNILV